MVLRILAVGTLGAIAGLTVTSLNAPLAIGLVLGVTHGCCFAIGLSTR